MDGAEHIPESLDAWTRNERVFNTLKKMGLNVIPIYSKRVPDRIEHFIVSCGVPREFLNRPQE